MDHGPRTISEAAPLIRAGELTPSDLLEQCLARIDRYEPKVRAWAYLDRERARADAARLTDELKTGQHRGPLHGIPVGVKDIIDVFDMPTGCGSKLWANSYARRDATCVERLRQAGAVIVGKTVTTAYASFDPSVTRNPWNLDRTPGGSSSGSAAAVACGMCLAALATQTGGSITRPASYCGVCSLKPTYGRVSVDGVLPLAPSMDHVGVMANCVRDLAVVFQTIAGPNGYPPPGMRFELGTVPDCLALLNRSPREAGRPIRLTGMFEELADREMLDLYESSLSSFEFDCAPIDRVVPPAGFARILEAHHVVMATEAAWYHKERLRRVPDDYPPRIRELIERGSGGFGPDYFNADILRSELREEIANALAGTQTPYRAGVFITPATTSFAPTAETTGDPAMNSPWSLLGLPTVSVPGGRSKDGLPFAVQFIGQPGAEAETLAVARHYESLSEYLRPYRSIPE